MSTPFAPVFVAELDDQFSNLSNDEILDLWLAEDGGDEEENEILNDSCQDELNRRGCDVDAMLTSRGR